MNKREERWEMEKKERNIGVSGGWGGSVVGVKEPYRRPMINKCCEVCFDLVVNKRGAGLKVDFVPVRCIHTCLHVHHTVQVPEQFTLE